MTFLFPALLGAGAAAAAPVLIHLLLRTRPRRMLFPPLRFVRRTHRASRSMHRLKHLLLLAMRVALLLLLAALFARAVLPASGVARAGNVPVDTVILLDDSASMAYRVGDEPLLRTARRWATRLLQSLPSGSRVAVGSTTHPERMTALLADRRLLAERIAAIEQTPSDASAARAVARAAGLLELEADEQRRQAVYLLTDLTVQALRDVAGRPGDPPLTVLDVSAGEDTNAALGPVHLDAEAVPAGAEVRIRTTVRCGDAGGPRRVAIELDGELEDERHLGLQAGTTATVSFSLRPQREGLRSGRLLLGGSDPLAVDDVRYFTLRVDPPARMLSVSDSASAGGAGFLMRQAVAPRVGRGWLTVEPVVTTQLGPDALVDADIVLLTDVGRLDDGQWGHLERFVRDGGAVWIVTGELLTPAAYNVPPAQRLLPARLGGPETLAPPHAWEPVAPDHPLLAAFADPDNPPLSEVEASWRLGIETLAADTEVLVRYEDGLPVILYRPVGTGRVLLWNASPLPGASNLARTPQFPILALQTARVLARGEARTGRAHWGQRVTLSAPANFEARVATALPPGEEAERPLLVGADQTVTIDADRLGHWTVRFSDGKSERARAFSVNVSPAESDLTPADPDELRARLGGGRLTVARSLDDLEARSTAGGSVDLSGPLLLAVLALLLGEIYFANRFYRRADDSPAS